MEAAAASGGLGEAPTHTPRQVPPPQTGLRRLAAHAVPAAAWCWPARSFLRGCRQMAASAGAALGQEPGLIAASTIFFYFSVRYRRGQAGAPASFGPSWSQRPQSGHLALAPEDRARAPQGGEPAAPMAGSPPRGLGACPSRGGPAMCPAGPRPGGGAEAELQLWPGGRNRLARRGREATPCGFSPLSPRAPGAPGRRKGQVRWGRGGTGGCDIGPSCST